MGVGDWDVTIHSIERVDPLLGEATSVLVPIVDPIGEGSAAEARLADDLELTPEFEAVLRDEPDVDLERVRTAVGEPLASWTREQEQPLPLEVSDELARYRPAIRLDSLRSIGGEAYEVRSSALRAPDVWRVSDVKHLDGPNARLSLGRAGLRELNVDIPAGAVGRIQLGQVVIGTRELYSKQLWGFGRLAVEFQPDPEQPPPIGVWIPLLRLHQPRHAGCKATYSTTRATDNALDVNLTVMGMGGGGGVKITSSFGREYTTESECLELVLPAKLQLLVGTTIANGTEIAYGIRGNIADVDVKGAKTRAVPANDDACERSRSAIAGLPVQDALDQTEAPRGEYWNEITIKREVHGKVTLGLEVGGHTPVKFGIDYLRTTSVETTIRTLLAPGARYVAYAPYLDGGTSLAEQLEICWTTKA